MAEKISVQIALEGGQEVARQLEGIGEAGQKAFADISKSAEQVGGFKNLKPEEVTQKLRAMGIEGTAAFERIQKAVQSAANLEKVVRGVQGLETAFVALGRAAGPIGLAIAAGIKAATTATIAFAAEINKVTTEATKLGMTVTQFDQMRRNMERLGVSSQTAGQAIKAFNQVLEQSKIDNVNKAFKELQEAATRGFGATGTQQLKTLQQAAEGTGKAAELAAEKLKELGQAVPPNTIAEQFKKISDSIAGLSRADAAATVIQALQAIQDPAQRAALAIKFFGDAGAEIAQKLQTGAAGAASFKSAVSNLITPEDAAKADALDSAINRLNASLARFGSVQFAPAITTGIDGIAAAVDRLNARLSQNPWTTLASGAASINPAVLAVQGLTTTLESVAPAAQAAGQAGAQAGQQGAQGFQVWNEQLGKAVPLVQQVAAAPDASSWTSWASTVVSALQSAITKLLEWIGLKDKAGAGSGGGAGASAPRKARGGLIGGRGSGTSDSNLAWLSRGEFVIRAAAVRQFGAGFFAALNGGRIPGFAAGGPATASGVSLDGFINAMGRAIGDVKNIWDALINGMQEVYQTVLKASETIAQTTQTELSKVVRQSDQVVRTTVGSLQRLQITLATILGETVNTLQRKARGGLIGGRGSGTSDSNLAWLSRGEFVINAAAVRHFGAGFFAALNAGLLPGFALGGLVPRPAFANGGPVGSMSHVTIQFPGVPPVGGLRASSAVVEELQRSAALAQVRSGGRKPSRYS